MYYRKLVKVDEYIDKVYIGEYDMYIGVYDKGAKHRVLK